ncbi:hypothetical protein FRB99_006347 [Tulasnella sp. 403]|nr:hypothetical protein FRB99_006347 [Tulasnella sp. 403]
MDAASSDSSDYSGGGLHFSFDSDVMLFTSLRLSSWSSFIIVSVFTSCICLAERGITFLLTSKYFPIKWQSRSTPCLFAAWRTSLYAMATFLRLAYMLISMSLHIGIIIVIVMSLALGQFFIELRSAGGFSDAHASSKGTIYSPLPSYPTGHPSGLYRLQDDLELAQSPSNSGTWDGSREARDKARQIMLGLNDHSTATSGPFSAQIHHQAFDTRRKESVIRTQTGQTSPIHRRQSSASGVSSPLRSYRGSANSLQGLRSGRNNLTPTNSARKALFQIGSTDEGNTSDSD